MRIQVSHFTISALMLASMVCCGWGNSAEVQREPLTEAFREGEPPSWYLVSSTAATYASATAHQPLFADQALWNDDARQAAYAKQVWPAARVLVWASPGSAAKDGWEAKHWLENGKPALKGIDPDTDLVLPDAPGEYFVSLTDGRKYQPAAFRHLTIGKRAMVAGHFATRGNVWVKAGGGFMNMDQSVGDGHVFLRDDNLGRASEHRGRTMVDHFFVRKSAGSSVEFIGIFKSEDNWQCESGMMVVAPQSEIGMGNRTPPIIRKGASIAIMSGGYLSRRSNCDWGTDLTVEGSLLGGLPGRPLTSDARLGLGWKTKGMFLTGNRGGRYPGPDNMGMVVADSGRITVTTADPAKARLLINCSKRDNDSGQIANISQGQALNGEALVAKMNELPRLTDMSILGEVTWGGLRFDNILKGGIKVKAIPDLVTGPIFGQGNAGTPRELFTLLK